MMNMDICIPASDRLRSASNDFQKARGSNASRASLTFYGSHASRGSSVSDTQSLTEDNQCMSFSQAAVSIQSYARAFVARKRFLKLRKGVIKIQAYIRGFITRRKVKKMESSARTIQKRYKGYKVCKQERQNFLQFKTATRTIQNEWRRWKQRNGVEYIL